jgi:hypothetical protein
MNSHWGTQTIAVLLLTTTPAAAQAWVTVDAGTDIGPSPMSEMMCALTPYPHPYFGPNDPLVQAWNASGIHNMHGIVFFEEAFHGIRVTRNASGTVDLDFTWFDVHVNEIVTLCHSRPIFNAIWIPQALSSNPSDPEYYSYAPADLTEWYDVVYRTVDHLVQMGFAGSIFEVWSEPDGTWFGHPARPGRNMQDFIDLYVATYHAVKDADPTALVAGPKTASQDSVTIGGHPWGLPEFLYGLEAWNQANPGRAAPIEILCWHDYVWTSFDVSHGADFVDSVVATIGVPSLTFPVWPPYMLGEWNHGFYTYVDPLQRQAYLIHNLIKEADPRTRRFLMLGIYSFHLGPLGIHSDLVEVNLQGDVCYRPSFSGMQMLTAMQAGNCVDAAVYDPSPADPLTALSTLDGTTVRVALCNPRNQPKTVALYLADLPTWNGPMRRTVQLIGNGRSEGCDGLGLGRTRIVQAVQGQYFMTLQLSAYGSALITLVP